LGRPLSSEDGSLRLLKDANGVRIKCLAFRRYARVAMGSRKEFESKFVFQIGHSLADRGLRNAQGKVVAMLRETKKEEKLG
jgi:hypothetical protein